MEPTINNEEFGEKFQLISVFLRKILIINTTLYLISNLAPLSKLFRIDGFPIEVFALLWIPAFFMSIITIFVTTLLALVNFFKYKNIKFLLTPLLLLIILLVIGGATAIFNLSLFDHMLSGH